MDRNFRSGAAKSSKEFFEELRQRRLGGEQPFVADNVLTFANGVQPQALVGLAIVLALVILLANKIK